MADADIRTQETYGVPGIVLMERAALGICEEIEKRISRDAFIGVLAGSGNNGGDGIAAARILFEDGYNTAVYLAGDRDRLSPSNQIQLQSVRAYGIPVVNDYTDLKACNVIIDALLGTGLSREVTGKYEEIIEDVAQWNAFKVAVDIPSGISSETGKILGTAMKCDLTVTFGFEKLGQHLYPGKSYCGTVIRKHIGITAKSLKKEDYVFSLDHEDLINLLPRRRPDSNKGTYGKLLCFTGSKGMAGASVLSARSAIASGLGMVKVVTDEANRVIIQTSVPEALFDGYNDVRGAMNAIESSIQWFDAMLIGPGLSTSDKAKTLIKLLIAVPDDKPIVLDADALNIIASDTSVYMVFDDICKKKDVVITPHIMEMSRLCGKTVGEIKLKPVETAREYSRKHHVNTVLKDAVTVISCTDGRTYLSDIVNDGMSTAGSGDVLSGIIASLTAQSLKGSIAAPLGVYIHSLAGQKAAELYGRRSMKAGDIEECIPMVLKDV